MAAKPALTVAYDKYLTLFHSHTKQQVYISQMVATAFFHSVVANEGRNSCGDLSWYLYNRY